MTLLLSELSIAQDLSGLQTALSHMAMKRRKIALVPTMGALHAGHASLIELARRYAEEVVVSIFVNPTQFGPNEDFERYPRSLEADVALAKEAGATLVYAPPVQDVYPEGFSTLINVGGLDNILCGAHRPGHFAGVATIVCKLLLRVLPHVAIFGEKDYQQLCIIRRMVADLDMPIDIIGAPILRESDGLAMSSRNRYLSPDERKQAAIIHHTLQTVAQLIRGGADVADTLDQGIASLRLTGFEVEYLELRDAHTLSPVTQTGTPARLLTAVRLGHTRLIDNMLV